MYHSIDILRSDDSGIRKNTWEDWHLIPTSRPTFSMPKMKQRTIDIPGSDGILDLSDSYGTAVFENREGSFEFIVSHEYDDWYPESYQWQNLYSEIANTLHGRKVRIILEDDPNYYYEGRVTVNEWRSEPLHSLIVLDYSVGPYKWALASSLDDWLWDPFDFDKGVIREYRNIQIDGAKLVDGYSTVRRQYSFPETIISSYELEFEELHFVGSRKFSPVSIIYFDANNLIVELYDKGPIRSSESEHSASEKKIFTSDPITGEGTVVFSDVFLEDKEYVFRFKGSGTISLDYREGSL